MSPSPLSLPPPPPPLAAVDTRSFFKLHWTCFRVLGINAPSSNTYYSVLLQVLVTLCYPFHLALALFSSPDASINIQNLTVCVTCVACSMKFVFYATRLSRIRELESIIAALDARARSLCERRYFVQLRKELRRITICFLCIYTVVGVTAELMFIFHNERNLLYPAWFPFDWRASNLKFYAAHSYQIVGISYQLLQNFVNDCFPTMALALLSAHIKLLGIRVSQIGHETASLGANEAELLHCIKDQEQLYKYNVSFLWDAENVRSLDRLIEIWHSHSAELRYSTVLERHIFSQNCKNQDQEQLYNVLNIIQNIISLPMFLQFTVTAINLCLGMAALLYFVDAPFDRLYYLAYLLALPLQIFPICYYGTTFQLLFDKLHVEMFASNWVEQTHKFRKHMILFCERSLMSQTAMAGGIVRIHLDTFISTCKAAYSLLAVIMKMNE